MVNSTTPEDPAWMVRNVTPKSVAKLIGRQPDGAFVIQPKKDETGYPMANHYSLGLKIGKTIRWFGINYDNGFRLQGAPIRFAGLQNLVEYYAVSDNAGLPVKLKLPSAGFGEEKMVKVQQRLPFEGVSVSPRSPNESEDEAPKRPLSQDAQTSTSHLVPDPTSAVSLADTADNGQSKTKDEGTSTESEQLDSGVKESASVAEKKDTPAIEMEAIGVEAKSPPPVPEQHPESLAASAFEQLLSGHGFGDKALDGLDTATAANLAIIEAVSSGWIDPIMLAASLGQSPPKQMQPPELETQPQPPDDVKQEHTYSAVLTSSEVKAAPEIPKGVADTTFVLRPSPNQPILVQAISMEQAKAVVEGVPLRVEEPEKTLDPPKSIDKLNEAMEGARPNSSVHQPRARASPLYHDQQPLSDARSSQERPKSSDQRDIYDRTRSQNDFDDEIDRERQSHDSKASEDYNKHNDRGRASGDFRHRRDLDRGYDDYDYYDQRHDERGYREYRHDRRGEREYRDDWEDRRFDRDYHGDRGQRYDERDHRDYHRRERNYRDYRGLSRHEREYRDERDHIRAKREERSFRSSDNEDENRPRSDKEHESVKSQSQKESVATPPAQNLSPQMNQVLPQQYPNMMFPSMNQMGGYYAMPNMMMPYGGMMPQTMMPSFGGMPGWGAWPGYNPPQNANIEARNGASSIVTQQTGKTKKISTDGKRRLSEKKAKSKSQDSSKNKPNIDTKKAAPLPPKYKPFEMPQASTSVVRQESYLEDVSPGSVPIMPSSNFKTRSMPWSATSQSWERPAEEPRRLSHKQRLRESTRTSTPSTQSVSFTTPQEEVNSMTQSGSINDDLAERLDSMNIYNTSSRDYNTSMDILTEDQATFKSAKTPLTTLEELRVKYGLTDNSDSSATLFSNVISPRKNTYSAAGGRISAAPELTSILEASRSSSHSQNSMSF